MRNLLIAIGLLSLVGLTQVFAEDEDSLDWQTDFQEFLKTLQEVSEQSKGKNNGDVKLEELNEIFLNKTVNWSGTLKYVHVGRPYFKDSFIKIADKVSMSCVMYYPKDDAISLWEELENGSKVSYTGIIKAVHITKLKTGEPFPYIDLVNVKPVQDKE